MRARLTEGYALVLVCALIGGWWGCASSGGTAETGRISLAKAGDPVRRASTRLVVDGLEADASGAEARALSRYQRAVQIDPGNPYAQLALARYWIEAGDAALALAHLDHAELLFESTANLQSGFEAHLLGLRGLAMQEFYPPDGGSALLERARRASPRVWDDAWISADELQ